MHSLERKAGRAGVDEAGAVNLEGMGVQKE